MSAAFARTMRSIQGDGGRGSLGWFIVIVGFFAVWLIWFLFAQVPIYQSSSEARLEVSGSVYPVQTATGGKVTANYMELGRQVREGEILLELDSLVQHLETEELEAERRLLETRIASLNRNMKAKKAVHEKQIEEAAGAVAEAKAKREEFQIEADLAEAELDRLKNLAEGGHIPELELIRAGNAFQQKMAKLKNQDLNVLKLNAALDAVRETTLAEMTALEGQAAQLQADVHVLEARTQQLKNAVETRKIRAQVSGTIAEIQPCRPGTYLDEGSKVASILPNGGHRIVAFYPSTEALGIIEKGQSAQFRLFGFPWTQYGSIQAVVEDIAYEEKEGKVRVELLPVDSSFENIPKLHGLRGLIEIRVKELSPAVLVLREVGKLVGTGEAPSPEENRTGEFAAEAS